MAELPLIVGAGPVGLAAAVFLTQNKTPVRIIERLTQRSAHSKALAINPRTLELLESTGVTDRMLAMGKRITGTTFWGMGQPIAQMPLSDLRHKYPFMIALSQATSERLLEEALIHAGGSIERGTELAHCRSLIGKVEATLRDSRNSGGGNSGVAGIGGTGIGGAGSGSSGDIGSTGAVGSSGGVDRGEQVGGEVVQAPWLFAADGAHSAARQSLKIDFKGSTFPTTWSLVDVPMDVDLPEDRANILFLPAGGFLFCMRVIGDDAVASSRPLWRLMGDVDDPLARLAEVRSFQADAPVWSSKFHVAHRLASVLQVDKICLGGDAAHVHSPAGARGMNLGIEDAWEFATRVSRGMLAGYGSSRITIDRAVVRRISRITRLVRGESIAARAARSVLLPAGSDIPLLRRRLLQTLAGVDHDLAIR